MLNAAPPPLLPGTAQPVRNRADRRLTPGADANRWGFLAITRLPIAIVLLAFGTKAVLDTDIWGHMRFGLDLLSTHALPAVDHYSFTSTQPWVNHEWASDLLFAIAYTTGGLPGLVALRILSLSVALIVLNRGLRNVSWPLRDVLIAAAVLMSTPMLGTVRPQIFSFPLYALTLVALAEDAVWLPAVFAVWANLHGGWLIGFGAVIVRTVTAPMRRRLLIALGCAAATLLTPFGFSLWVSLIEAILRGWADIVEWQPIWKFSYGVQDSILWSVAILATGFALYKKLPAATWQWLWTFCVAIAAARVRRHLPFFTLSVLLLLLSHLRARGVDFSQQRLTPQVGVILVPPILAALFIAGVLLRPAVTCLPDVPRVEPEPSAVAFIRSADLRGRVVMWFNWGLYAVWQVGDRLKVSYDNRRETVYSGQTVADHQAFYFGGDAEYPDRIGADYAWLSPDLPVVKQLTERGWHIIFRNPTSVILGRENRPLVEDASPAGESCFPEP
jgi:hypothetical protein